MKAPKLFCILALAAGLSIIKTQAQTTHKADSITFKNAADLPYPLTWTTSVTDGAYIYTIGGYKGYYGFTSEVLKYDPNLNKWSVLADLRGNRIQTSAAYVPATGKIYIFGGVGGVGGTRNTAQIFQSVQTIDVKTGALENLHIQNPMASTYGSAVEWENKIYLFGGTRDGNHTIKSLYQFDPQTAKFTQLAEMPESLQTNGTVVNGVIYTFGGYDAFLKHQSYSINAYDIKTNTWKTLGKLPEFLSANIVAACGTRIFVAAGFDDEKFIGYYDITANQFVKLKSNMQRRRAAASAVYNNYLYIFGGSTRFNVYRNSTLQTMQVANLAPLLSGNASK